MHKSPEISAELRETSPSLAGLSLPMPYTVPQGYFDGLALQVMQQIGSENNLPVMQSASYRVPQGYFDTLATSILSKIKNDDKAVKEVDEELKMIAPFLGTVSKKNIYRVPQGYFDDFSVIPEQNPAKLVKMNLARKWTQYAAAAVIAGVLVTGAFLYKGTKNPSFEENTATDLASGLNTISDSDLASYVSYASGNEPGTDVGNGISNMSDEELNHYLSENDEMEIIPASN